MSSERVSAEPPHELPMFQVLTQSCYAGAGVFTLPLLRLYELWQW